MRLGSDLYRKRGDAGAVVENKPGEVVDMSLEDSQSLDTQTAAELLTHGFWTESRETS